MNKRGGAAIAGVVWILGCLAASAQFPTDINLQLERGGRINAVAQQSGGKIIIGGYFKTVNGVHRRNLARLNSDGTLDTRWNPDADSEVLAVAVGDTNIYVGGQFQNIGPQARSRIAKLDNTYGYALTNSLAVGANGTVRALAISGLDVYVGGDFTTIAGSNRAYIAMLKAGSYPDANFTNGANGSVYALIYSGGDVFAGGLFTQIGGASRHYLAQVHYFNGAAMAWDPSPNNFVGALSADASCVYAGGSFSTIGGRTRPGIAKIDRSTAQAVLGWDAQVGGAPLVEAIAKDLFSVYFAGAFTNVAGQAKEGFAKVSAASGALDPQWTNEPDSDVNALWASTATNVLVAGRFTYLGTHWAQGIARMTTSGVPDAAFGACAGDPAFPYCIVTQSDGRVIVGGNFSSAGAKEAQNLARFFADGTRDTNWNPRPDGTVNKLIVRGTNIYVCGTFSRIGGQDLSRLARLSDSTGEMVAGWTNRVYGSVHDIADDGTYLYAGGTLTNIGGRACRYLARIRYSNNQVDATWLPVASNTVEALAADDTHLYVGGAFRWIGGSSVSNLARFPLSSSSVNASWTPSPNDTVNVLALGDTNVYAGGFFSSIGGQALPDLARVAKAGSGLADAGWNPQGYGGRPEVIDVRTNWVYVGGAFRGIGGEDYEYAARLSPIDAAADPSWHPEPDGSVYALCAAGDQVAIGGPFASVGGVRRGSFAWLAPFAVREARLSNAVPTLVWLGGTNKTYKVEFAGRASGLYAQVVTNFPGTGDATHLSDADRQTYTQVFYRVTRE